MAIQKNKNFKCFKGTFEIELGVTRAKHSVAIIFYNSNTMVKEIIIFSFLKN